MKLPEFVLKYLSSQKLQRREIFPEQKKLFDNIIVIPALNESDNVENLINSLSHNDEEILSKSLALFVINNSSSASKNLYSANVDTANAIKREIIKHEKSMNIAFIDAYSPGVDLPVKHAGAGLARKIGLDLSLEYFDYSNSAVNILICLDADCTVSANYLRSIVSEFNKKTINAATVKFEHPFSVKREINLAITNYEIYLHYYVMGLMYAGSKFSHFSVGSTMICDAETYIKVGGMNKRKGGEDFYFLNEIAKITNIAKIRNAIVYPSSRISDRVPFGTGPRIKRFTSKIQNEYSLYSPEIFEILKSWLEIYSEINGKKDSIFNALNKAKDTDIDLFNFLILQNFEKDWLNIIENSPNHAQIEKQKIIWMDGFRTLKLIHQLRDQNHKNIPMFEAIDIMLKKMGNTSQIQRNNEIPELEIQIHYLNLLREITNHNL